MLLCPLAPLPLLAFQKLEWHVLWEGHLWYCLGLLQFWCIHDMSIAQVCMSLSISMTLFFNFLWLMEKIVKVFSAIINLLWRVSFSFFRSSNLASMRLSFSKNSLLSFINSICFDIRLSCSFITKSISCSLVIFSNCFLVRMLLLAIFILLTISHSALVEKVSKLWEHGGNDLPNFYGFICFTNLLYDWTTDS